MAQAAAKPALTERAVSASAAATATGGNGNREFLALPGSSYIIELAHANDKSELDSLRGSLQLARGELYELHLQREGHDWWLLAWGTFDSVAAARAARGELPTDAPINAGWPRLIAPLQAEARRARD
jgi:septal ring-binding cell division protein DamX